MQELRKPKTAFGQRVDLFCSQTGMTKTRLAKAADVSYIFLLEVCKGDRPGNELIPKVTDFMSGYLKENNISDA